MPFSRQVIKLDLAICWLPYNVHDLRRQSSTSNNHNVCLLGYSPLFPILFTLLYAECCNINNCSPSLSQTFAVASPVFRFTLQTTMTITVAFNCWQNLVCDSTWYIKIMQYVAGNSKCNSNNFGKNMTRSVVCSCSCTLYKGNDHQPFLFFFCLQNWAEESIIVNCNTKRLNNTWVV